MIGGTGYFDKTYHKEESSRFSFKHIKELCYKFNINELVEMCLNDYKEYCNKYNKAV
jgi:hypothetical protein